ncbi:hypothetical protein LGH83_13980 [Lichenihabitans sp. PAMC28606]|uniref:hypothetical protein n=1 Tax=Lichenihabitans sp. PAMC28606 TaxID=2880932 RepID=UPI001D0B4FC0|nr:hypothetical protein [Lichenihabitans sp. PAMC28606]UDL93669.1 hypothetical protein LGH83_13980 [Lichenihabitans sp. PAMC28606]
MPECPRYRIRLFLSVDLVGSTAFKLGRGADRAKVSNPHPIWVDEIRKFYRGFPATLTAKFRRLAETDKRADIQEKPPLIWKTIGDEIVFCNKIEDIDHLSICINAFISTLDMHSKALETRRIEDAGKLPAGLAVKGTAWIAAFPYPNISVSISQKIRTLNLETTEEFEASAETNPQGYDFLGQSIDTGFRISTFSGIDRISISAELAYLLCDLAAGGKLNVKLHYAGRETLKGVTTGKTYPITVLDTERNPLRKSVKEHEKTLMGVAETKNDQLKAFLAAYFLDEAVEVPSLSETSLPENYRTFALAWAATAKEEEEKTKRELEGEAQRAQDRLLDKSHEANVMDRVRSIGDTLIKKATSLPSARRSGR